MEGSTPKIRKRWSADRVLEEIRTAENQSPKYHQKMNPGLYGAAVRHFGSWKKAVEAAGLSYCPQTSRRLPGSWDKERCLEAIRGLERKYSAFVRQYHADIYSAALRIFGSWKSAVEAAGYDYSKISREWRVARRKEF